MSNLLSRLKSYIDLKNNRLAKIYLLIFYVLNAIYLYLEVSKNKLLILFNSHPEQQEFYFEKARDITNLTSFIDILLVVINLLYLLLNTIKYRNKRYNGVIEYLIISFISLLSIKIFSIILHTIFSAYYLLESTILITQITLLVLAITLIVSAYKYLLSRSKHEI